MERYTLFFPQGLGPTSILRSRARFRFALLGFGRAAASLGLQPVSNSSTETSRAREKEREEKRGALSRSQKGLTDTWPLNGANLRAPAVTLLIR